MSNNDDGHITSWPAHMPDSRPSRLTAGHAAGQTDNGGRTPTPAERQQAKAIRSAIERGDLVSPVMRIAAGYDQNTTEES